MYERVLALVLLRLVASHQWLLEYLEPGDVFEVETDADPLVTREWDEVRRSWAITGAAGLKKSQSYTRHFGMRIARTYKLFVATC